ncbi:MAG TPA: hypothetical protein VGC14_06210 [Rhizobium sp.]
MRTISILHSDYDIEAPLIRPDTQKAASILGLKLIPIQDRAMITGTMPQI